MKENSRIERKNLHSKKDEVAFETNENGLCTSGYTNSTNTYLNKKSSTTAKFSMNQDGYFRIGRICTSN